MPVIGITNAVAIAAGGDQSCALLADGTVQCWGSNSNGQLCNGTITDSSTPVAVGGISSAIAIAVGSSQSFALLSTGAMQCWGSNSDGELGNGSLSLAPVNVSGVGLKVLWRKQSASCFH